MMKAIILLSLALPAAAGADNWTLRRCADYAVDHSITIQQARLQQKNAEIQLSTSRNSRLPDLNAGASEQFSFGRSLTASNTYDNTNTSSTSLNLSTSLALYTGGRTTHTIALNRLQLEAASRDLERAANDLRTQVAAYYMQVLYAMETEDAARLQVAIDSMQAVRLRATLEAGKAALADVSQQEAALAQSRLTLTQAANNVRQQTLYLTQLLELPQPDGFTIERPDTASLTLAASELTDPQTVYATALGLRPEIAAEQLRLKATDHNISIAKAGLLPSLSLSGGLGTNYYKTSGYRADSFGKQLENNFSQFIGASLSVPIFNRFATRNSIRQARLQRDQQQLTLDNTRKQLYKEIQEACLNASNARARYTATLAAVSAATDAFTLMSAKYESGKATITEFNEAKNNRLRTACDLAKAKYEYLYSIALLHFYSGGQLEI